jgi:ATP-binding cassette subfamily B protein
MRAFLSDDYDKRPNLSWVLLRRVWEFARPYRWRVVGLLITILLISTISLVSPLLFRAMIDVAIPEGNSHMITLLALGMMAVPLVSGVIGVAQRWLNSQIGEGVIYDLRRALYTHMQQMSLRFFTQTRTGEIMSRLNNDVIGAQRAISDTAVSIISNIVKVVATLAIMFAIDWRLTLLGMTVLPLFMLPARRVGRRLRSLRRKSMVLNAEMNATMNETLNVSGALLVKLFGRERYELDRFSHDAEGVRDIGIEQAVVMRWFFMLLGVVSAIGTAVVYLVGGHMVLAGTFTIGTIVAFAAYLGQLYGPLTSLTTAPVEFATSMVSFERVFEVLDSPIEIKEQPDARVLARANGRIEFDHICFDYEHLTEGQSAGLEEVARYGWRSDGDALLQRGKEQKVSENGDELPVIREPRWALRDVSFAIEPGQLAALVGPSGAGKTTITYMIPRLYDPTDGHVLIDDNDIREVTLQSLADNIGMVTQETYLFYDTIRANLVYANWNATEQQMVAAAKAANIHDFIASLSDGYDTVVGERGYRLSGGERQRIAIARVLLKDARILVLDEATSSLDSLSEALIQEALTRVMKGRTSLVIAHRLSTILAADLILVMEKGRLVEHGTHTELLQRGGLYATLYETQFRPSQQPGDLSVL